MRVLTKRDTKAARAYLDWTAGDLAAAAGVSIDTIRSFESGRTKTLSAGNQAAVTDALETAGIRFLEPSDVSEGVGVSLLSVKGGEA